MPTTYLTQEGYQKLQEELDYLRTVKRQEVANRLHEAMEGGELIEDAEYEAAKN
jgi:transcription elongation factor GreA